MASNREEFRALAPLVVATLNALNTFTDEAFRVHLSVCFCYSTLRQSLFICADICADPRHAILKTNKPTGRCTCSLTS